MTNANANAFATSPMWLLEIQNPKSKIRNSLDYIRLKGLVFFAHHGVLPQEQEIGQKFELDVELAGDLSEAGRSDDLSRTYNYDRVYRIVQATVTGDRFNLIEALAEAVCLRILDIYPDVQVTTIIRKPNAPLPGLFGCVEVQLTRGPQKPVEE